MLCFSIRSCLYFFSVVWNCNCRQALGFKINFSKLFYETKYFQNIISIWNQYIRDFTFFWGVKFSKIWHVIMKHFPVQTSQEPGEASTVWRVLWRGQQYVTIKVWPGDFWPFRCPENSVNWNSAVQVMGWTVPQRKVLKSWPLAPVNVTLSGWK